MTKICSNCKTDNPDNSEFCQSCGTAFTEATNTVLIEEKSKSGIGGFWNKGGKGGKAAIGFGVCCLGLLIIFAVIAIVLQIKLLIPQQHKIQLQQLIKQ